jgi:PKD repeat protein
MKKTFIYFLLTIIVSACFKETVLPTKADFVVKYKNDSQSAPAQITIINTSENAEYFKWSFEGANISIFTERTPPELLFSKPGKYNISLEVSNADGQISKKTTQINIEDPIGAKFDFSYEINNFAPAKVSFQNKSISGTRYEWSFEKGDKVGSTEQNPTITFNEEGVFRVSLKVYNGSVFKQKDSTIRIGATLMPDFVYTDLDYNFNYETPLMLKVANTSKGSVGGQWAVSDASASIKSAKDSVTTITLSEAKTYKITFNASNGKSSRSIEKEIIVKLNSNLLTFENVKIGVYESEKSNNYYVSRRNQVLSSKNVDTLSYGKELDIVFFARDDDFSYNRFISPDKTGTLLMKSIPNAQQTIFINRLEDCLPCTKITDTQFNNIKNAKDFDAFTFKFGEGVVEGFDKSTLPRYVPFKTNDNRLGIIKIKAFDANGITADIKVYRKP